MGINSLSTGKAGNNSGTKISAGASSLRSMQRTFSNSSNVLANKPVNTQPVPLANMFDEDPDQLTASQWEASPPPKKKSSTALPAPYRASSASTASAKPSGALGNGKGTNNAAASSAHWGKKGANLGPALPQVSSNSKDGKAIIKKRQFPWDQMADPVVKKHKTSASIGSEKGAYHTLASASGSTSAGPSTTVELLTDASLNIKQKVILSTEQQKILAMVVNEGKNIFFTGSAGTGKSVLLREIIASLKSKHRRPEAVCITASTGMAACNIGGTTIHSFAGIGLGAESVNDLVNKIRKNRKAAARWQRAQCLVIDEVSMVDGDLFDKLAGIACALRKKPDKPFGGLQLIVTGDFFQLPPVSKNGTAKFAFEAREWIRCIDHTVNLTQVFRQKSTEFIDMLNEMRFGQLSAKSIAKFRALAREPAYPNDGIAPTELFALRAEVERSNTSRLTALSGETQTYDADDSGVESGQVLEKLLDNMMAPKRLVLKIGCQVMLIKNKDERLVNGSSGKVVAFAPPGAGPNDEADDSDAEREDVKPKIKSENKVENAAMAALKKKLVGAGGAQELVPWVEWQLPDGRKLSPEPVAREEFKIEQGEVVKARRKQFPMILAWAVSIHKSQGQTLQRVKVDLGKVFEAGQSYVALSRATSMEALQILRFDPSKVRCHPKVAAWSKSLETL